MTTVLSTKILFVKGSPKDTAQSYSLRLAQSFMDVYIAEHPSAQVTELDLYEAHIPLMDRDVLNAQAKLAQQAEINPQEAVKIQRLGELVDQFLASDVIVLAAPMWNFGYPPMVKAYMDAIAAPGKTFRYTASGPVGLAVGKKAFIVEARGGIWSHGPAQNMEHSQSHLRAFFGHLGVTDVQVLLAEGLALDPSKSETILAEASALAQKVAKAQRMEVTV